jgi:hypothetical protein
MFAPRIPRMLLLAGLANLAGWSQIAGQVAPTPIAPPPYDPLDPVTTAPHVPNAQERDAALKLLRSASQVRFLGPVHTLKSSFVASWHQSENTIPIP